MSGQKREYVPGQDAALDKLIATYHEIEEKGGLDAEERDDERSIKDPFGFGEARKSPAKRWSHALEVVERQLAFFKLCSGEYKLSPEEMIFATELFSINVLNTDDCPLSAVKVEAARKAAFEYYKAGVSG